MDKKQIGKQGEMLAYRYLLAEGYTILAQNWNAPRPKRGELDIIAQKDKIIIFVEVKTLSKNLFGYPEQQVDKRKEKMLWQTACAYVEEIDYEGEIRFDIIAITLDPFELKHYKDTFFPID